MLLLLFILGTWSALPALAQDEEAAEDAGVEADEADDTDDADEALHGALSTPDDEPASGVDIIVERDGQEVTTATTGADGTWRTPLPGPGDYTVRLDAQTLPEDVELRDPERESLEVSVRPGQDRRVLFPLGEREAAAARFFRDLAQPLWNGLKFGLIIAITSIGLSLVYGTTGLVNFAHGDMVTFGAVAAVMLNVGGPEIQLLGAGLLAVALGGLLGGGMERGIWLPLRRRKTGLIQMLVISIGLSLVIRYGILFFYGGRPRPFRDYAVMSPIRFGPVTTNARDLVVMSAAAVVLVAVGLMISRTKLGKAMRAVSDNVDLAEASGIDVKRVILWVWIMAGVLAALGGVFLGSVENINWLMGFRLLLLMFAGVILGGIGTAYGAMVGGILVGLITEVSVVWSPSELKMAWGLLALIIVLLFRPQGIFGRRERIG
jgi:neutral amino acid transport system permease protein